AHLALVALAPVAARAGDVEAIGSDVDQREAGVQPLPVEVAAERALLDLSDEAGLLLRLDGGRLMILAAAHRPALGDAPAACLAGGDQADLDDTVLDANGNRGDLLALRLALAVRLPDRP